jgi:hypothetical protein
MPHTAAMDLFVVPTISFDLLYVLVIVRLARRELVWINVTAHPTAEWIAQQITEAFPWNKTPRYLIRDRDRIYGGAVTRRLRAMGIRDKPIAPASPWQNSFAERLIGSIRRECVDHVIALGEQHLCQVVKSYASYYNTARTHRALAKDAPVSRPIQRIGRIVSACPGRWTSSPIRQNLSFQYTQHPVLHQAADVVHVARQPVELRHEPVIVGAALGLGVGLDQLERLGIAELPELRLRRSKAELPRARVRRGISLFGR